MGMAIFQERSPMSFQYPRPLPVSWGWKRPPLIITNTSCRSRPSGRAGSKASELLSVDQGNVTEVIQSLLLVSQQKTLAPPVTQSVSVCWQSIESMCVLKQVPAKATAWLMIYIVNQETDTVFQITTNTFKHFFKTNVLRTKWQRNFSWIYLYILTWLISGAQNI